MTTRCIIKKDIIHSNSNTRKFKKFKTCEKKQQQNSHRITRSNLHEHMMLRSTPTCLQVFPASEVMNTVTLVLLSPEPVQPGGSG